MKNYVSASDNITIVAPQAVKSGVPFLIGGFVGIPVSDADSGDLVAVITEGVVNLTVIGSANIGFPVYYNNGNITVTPTTVSCGFAIEAGNNKEIKVMLNKSISAPAAAAPALTDYAKKADLAPYFLAEQFNTTLSNAIKDSAIKALIKTAATT